MISVVIVSFNTKKYTKNCIDSLYERVKTKFELVVVDNNSIDGSREMLGRLSKKMGFKLLTLDENIGFGRANNEGAKVARGNWLFFLNSDTLVKNDIIRGLTRKILKDKRIGVIGVRLVGDDGVIQSNGGFSPRWWRIMSWMLFIDDLPIINKLISSIHPKKNYYQNNMELDWVTGAGLLIKAEYFNKVGGFDPKIFMYSEDMDLCLSVKDKFSKRVIYADDLYVIHYGGKSSSNENALYMEAVTIPYVVGKHYGNIEKVLATIWIKIGALLRLFIFGIIFYDEAKTRAYKKILA